MSIQRIKQYLLCKDRCGRLYFDIKLYFGCIWRKLGFAWDDVKTTKGRCLPGMVVRTVIVLPGLVLVLAAIVEIVIRFAAYGIDRLFDVETEPF